MGFFDRLQHGWNAFKNRDPTSESDMAKTVYVHGSSDRPDRARRSIGVDKSIINAIYTRIAVDAASVDIRHAKVDGNGRYIKTVESNLNDCLTVEANIDQTSRALKLDVYMSMLDEGCIAIIPTETTISPKNPGAFDVNSMRVAKIVEWYPDRVKVEAYNESTGRKECIIMSKRVVCICENPFYQLMNRPNSLGKRLIRKLALLDSVDEQASSGKLDVIIQLPYVVKSQTRKDQAEARRAQLEEQLRDSKYGIGYVDGTEKITQLNRPLENNLLKQIEYLTDQFYSQIGMTKEILNGTANEETMLNYNNRIIEPLVSTFTDEMKRKWITKTARTQGHTIMAFKDPFKLVPINDIAQMADVFTRNEILTSNEIREIIGMLPADDPNADRLVNSNMPQAYNGQAQMDESSEASGQTTEDQQIEIGKQIADAYKDVSVDQLNN